LFAFFPVPQTRSDFSSGSKIRSDFLSVPFFQIDTSSLFTPTELGVEFATEIQNWSENVGESDRKRDSGDNRRRCERQTACSGSGRRVSRQYQLLAEAEIPSSAFRRRFVSPRDARHSAQRSSPNRSSSEGFGCSASRLYMLSFQEPQVSLFSANLILDLSHFSNYAQISFVAVVSIIIFMCFHFFCYSNLNMVRISLLKAKFNITLFVMFCICKR